MTNVKAFRECISDNDNELIIYARILITIPE